MNPTYVLNSQPADVLLGVELFGPQDRVLVTVVEADHLHAVVAGFDGDRTDDAVDAGGRAAADYEREFSAVGGVSHRLSHLADAPVVGVWHPGRPSRGRLGTSSGRTIAGWRCASARPALRGGRDQHTV